jgi:hypothetical protein
MKYPGWQEHGAWGKDSRQIEKGTRHKQKADGSKQLAEGMI